MGCCQSLLDQDQRMLLERLLDASHQCTIPERLWISACYRQLAAATIDESKKDNKVPPIVAGQHLDWRKIFLNLDPAPNGYSNFNRMKLMKSSDDYPFEDLAIPEYEFSHTHLIANKYLPRFGSVTAYYNKAARTRVAAFRRVSYFEGNYIPHGNDNLTVRVGLVHSSVELQEDVYRRLGYFNNSYGCDLDGRCYEYEFLRGKRRNNREPVTVGCGILAVTSRELENIQTYFRTCRERNVEVDRDALEHNLPQSQFASFENLIDPESLTASSDNHASRVLAMEQALANLNADRKKADLAPLRDLPKAALEAIMHPHSLNNDASRSSYLVSDSHVDAVQKAFSNHHLKFVVIYTVNGEILPYIETISEFGAYTPVVQLSDGPSNSAVAMNFGESPFRFDLDGWFPHVHASDFFFKKYCTRPSSVPSVLSEEAKDIVRSLRLPEGQLVAHNNSRTDFRIWLPNTEDAEGTSDLAVFLQKFFDKVDTRALIKSSIQEDKKKRDELAVQNRLREAERISIPGSEAQSEVAHIRESLEQVDVNNVVEQVEVPAVEATKNRAVAISAKALLWAYNHPHETSGDLALTSRQLMRKLSGYLEAFGTSCSFEGDVQMDIDFDIESYKNSEGFKPVILGDILPYVSAEFYDEADKNEEVFTCGGYFAPIPKMTTFVFADPGVDRRILFKRENSVILTLNSVAPSEIPAALLSQKDLVEEFRDKMALGEFNKLASAEGIAEISMAAYSAFQRGGPEAAAQYLTDAVIQDNVKKLKNKLLDSVGDRLAAQGIDIKLIKDNLDLEKAQDVIKSVLSGNSGALKNIADEAARLAKNKILDSVPADAKKMLENHNIDIESLQEHMNMDDVKKVAAGLMKGDMSQVTKVAEEALRRKTDEARAAAVELANEQARKAKLLAEN